MIATDVNIEIFSSRVRLGNSEYAVQTSVKSTTPMIMFRTEIRIEPETNGIKPQHFIFSENLLVNCLNLIVLKNQNIGSFLKKSCNLSFLNFSQNT